MEKEAIIAGLRLDEWWNLTPREGKKYLDAEALKLDREMKKADSLNFALGKYVLLAFNDPKKYPNAPFTDGMKEGTPADLDDRPMDAVDEAKLNALFGGFVKKAKKNSTPEPERKLSGNTQA